VFKSRQTKEREPVKGAVVPFRPPQSFFRKDNLSVVSG